MLKSLNLGLFTCFLFAFLLGCSRDQEDNSQTAENNFSELIPTVELNNSLDISVIGGDDTFSLGSSIHISIVNHSTNYLTLSEDSFTRLFIYRNMEWVEVENELTYSGTVELSPYGTLLLDTHGSVIQPSLEKDMIAANKKVPLRILVIGEITKNDPLTGNLVGDYVDVYLTP